MCSGPLQACCADYVIDFNPLFFLCLAGCIRCAILLHCCVCPPIIFEAEFDASDADEKFRGAGLKAGGPWESQARDKERGVQHGGAANSATLFARAHIE